MLATETLPQINPTVVELMHRTLRISKKKIIKTLENDDFAEKPVMDECVAEILSDLKAPLGTVYLRINHSHIRNRYETAMRRSNNSRSVRKSFVRYAAKYFE